MEFLTRVLSGSSRLKERAREAEEVNQAFKENLDNLTKLLESEESDDVLALLDMVFESSFPEEQVFMKMPSRARLKSKKELVVRLLIGLDSLGVPTMAEMLVFIKKHGLEGVADSLLTLLDFLSPLLEGKEAPEFSTDDVVDAMDFEWHSSSRTGSPLLNAIASATSSPRASTASIGDSPLHPIILASPYRRALSERAMLISRANELGAKLVLDKTSTASTPPQRSQTISAMSASLQYPSANQDFRLNERTILETPASPEITQASTAVKPSSYSLDTLPESGLQRKHSRRSWSLRQLLVEDVIEELSGEGSVGASSKRNSSSSSWRQNSFEFTKIFTNTSETSSPMNPGLAADHNREGDTIAPDKTFLSSIFTQDRHVSSSSQKGSRRISPSPPLDEVALWREDSGGFSLDLVSSNKNAPQTSVDDAKHGTPLILHDLEAETCPSCVDVDALKPEEREIQLQSHGDVEEDARHAHSSHDHKEDARHAHSSSDHCDQDAHSLDIHEEDSGNAHTHVQSSSDDREEDVDLSYDSYEEAGHGHTNVEEDAIHAHTHEQDARHTFSLDTYDEDVDFEQDVWETASPKITPEDSSQEGHGFQWILAPLLLPSASNVSQDVNDQAGDISSFSLENDKDLNSMGGSSELEEHVNVSDDHFEKLLSELGAAEEDVLHKGGELPVINDIEGGQMGMHGDKENPSNLQDVEPSFEKGMQEDLTAVYDVVSDTTSAGENTPFVHTYPVESHVVNSSKEDSMVCEEANSKLDQHKQYGLERPTMVHEALPEGEVSMPCSEASEVGDANGIHSLHGKDHIHHQSPVYISSAESAVESTEPGHTDQIAVQLTDSGAQCKLLTATLRDLYDYIRPPSEGRTLQDLYDYIQPPAAHFTVAYAGSPLQISDYESASPSTKSRSAAQSTDTESAAQFTGSGMHNVPSTQVADTSESQPLHEDDYIQRPAAHLTEQYVGSFAAVNAANGDHMRAGFMASLKDHEHQNADHLYETDPPAAEYADLHGHPTSSSTLSDLDYQQRSDQNVLNQPATCNQPANCSDPTMDRWDSGTNVRRSKRKSSSMGKFTGGCLSCCWTKPHTNP